MAFSQTFLAASALGRFNDLELDRYKGHLTARLVPAVVTVCL